MAIWIEDVKNPWVWGLFLCFVLLSAWHFLFFGLLLDTCNSPLNPVESAACGLDSGFYEHGSLNDMAVDYVLGPAFLLYVPLSVLKPVYELSAFEIISPTVLDITYFVQKPYESLDVVILVIMVALNLVYLFLLATWINTLWRKGPSIRTLLIVVIALLASQSLLYPLY